MKIDVVLEATGVTTLTESDLKGLVKDQLYMAGEHWHKHFRRRHFHAIAFTYYRYTPRKKSYQWRKMRKGIGNNPLVFTGVSRRLSEGKTVRATWQKVDVVMPTRAFNFKPKNSQIDMRDEFTQINDSEHSIVDGLMEQGLTKSIQNFKSHPRASRPRGSNGRFIKG